jgi:hypothetical protein
MFGFQITPLGREIVQELGVKDALDERLQALNFVSDLADGFVRETEWSCNAEEWTNARHKIRKGEITDWLALSFYPGDIRFPHESIFAYVLTELKDKEDRALKRATSWRWVDHKTRVTDADAELLLVERVNLSSRKEPALFLNEYDRRVRSLCADWGAWEPFLSILLNYAKATNQEGIPEIKNYEDHLEQRHFGKHPFDSSFRGDFYLDIPLGEIPKMDVRNVIPGKTGHCYPAYMQDRDLYFGITLHGKKAEAKKRGKPIGEYGHNNPVYHHIRFRSAELPELLKATYNHYQRIEVEVPIILDAFLKKQAL